MVAYNETGDARVFSLSSSAGKASPGEEPHLPKRSGAAGREEQDA